MRCGLSSQDKSHQLCRVKVISGRHKGSEGKVTQVYRKKWVVHVERIHREKTNGATVPIPLRPSALVITKLKLCVSSFSDTDGADVEQGQGPQADS